MTRFKKHQSNHVCVIEYDTWMKWCRIYIVVPVGGAVVLIVAVAVYYCRGRCNTGMYSIGVSSILKVTF